MRNKDFAVYIMVHGRPEKNWTYNTLRKCGYTGKIYLVADNLDETIDKYKEKYGDELLVFDKEEVSKEMDSGDNSGDLRSTLFSANTIFTLAKEMNIKHFYIMCDDYYYFGYRYETGAKIIKNLDAVFDIMVDFYKSTNTTTIAFSQGGDHIGGFSGIKLKRKAMNSFLCSTERPFSFMGRMNEDVTTYVNLGGKGDLFFTFTNLQLDQKDSQSEKNGLTELYTDNGTYVKSFFSVMYNPSNVKVSMMNASNPRIHHVVKWANTTPMIISDDYKKGKVEDEKKVIARKVWNDIFNNETLSFNDFESYYNYNFKK
jgi:hypothetical protein